MPRKTLLFEISSSSTVFRIADTKPPMEEVSETGEGKFNGLKLRTLYTVKVRPGRRGDRIDGHGIVYAQGGGRAPYKISGLKVPGRTSRKRSGERGSSAPTAWATVEN